MRLVELAANKPSFKTVPFRARGLSLIVGKRTEEASTEPGRTYNAVGKSLIVYLVHFCLGSSSSKELKRKLPGWVFTLRIQMEGDDIAISRSTDQQNVFVVNGEEINREALVQLLGETTFDLPDEKYGITFRSLFPRFARMSKSSYTSVLRYIPMEDRKPFRVLVNTAFLLGIDPHIIFEKYRLNTDLREKKKLRKSFKSDPILRGFYEGDKHVDIELSEIEEQVDRLTQNLERFEVAEDYNAIKDTCAELRVKISEKSNQMTLAKNALASIENSLKERPDLHAERVQEVYAEASIAFSDQIQKKLEDVVTFHEQLLSKRESRLRREQHRIEAELKELTDQRRRVSKELDSNIRYLGEHRALEEYLALSDKRAALKERGQKLHDYMELDRLYERQINQIEADMALENIKAQEYIEDGRSLLQRIDKHFRSLCREFYPKSTCGISIENNTGKNQSRFNLTPAIQADTSDGVNEVKMFCFDMTLLELRQNHKVNFLFHDSRLFSDMDPRQRLTALRLAATRTEEAGTQYIASLNEDQIESFRELLEPGEYERVFVDGTVLELTDESAASKLLGVDVDLKYDTAA